MHTESPDSAHPVDHTRSTGSSALSTQRTPSFRPVRRVIPFSLCLILSSGFVLLVTLLVLMGLNALGSVISSFVPRLAQTADELTQTSQTPSAVPLRMAQVTSTVLNVRRSPDPTSSLQGKVIKGEHVAVLEDRSLANGSHWVRIRTLAQPPVEGWVNAGFLDDILSDRTPGPES